MVCNAQAGQPKFWGIFASNSIIKFDPNCDSTPFLGPYDVVLPRPKSFEEGLFILILASKWSTLSSRGVVKRRPRDPKIGMETQFGSKSIMEFEAKIPPKFGLR